MQEPANMPCDVIRQVDDRKPTEVGSGIEIEYRQIEDEEAAKGAYKRQ
jgi:hypothetical protein